jgi:hypothetical protein
MAGKIIRKKKDSDFVILKTLCLRDEKLSLKAKGLHSYLMQLPDDWDINIADLQNRNTDGRDSVTSAMNELLKAKYVTRIKILNSQKRFEGYDYTVFEERQNITIATTYNDKAENGKAVNGFPENGKADTTKVLSEVSIKEEKEDKSSLVPTVKPFEKMNLVERMREAYKFAIKISDEVAPSKEKSEAEKVCVFLSTRELRELFVRYMENRTKVKARKFKTLTGFYNSISTLSELSKNNVETALLLVKQSERMEWGIIVPLKNQYGQQSNQNQVSPPQQANIPVYGK